MQIAAGLCSLFEIRFAYTNDNFSAERHHNQQATWLVIKVIGQYFDVVKA